MVMHEEEVHDVVAVNIRSQQPRKDIDVYLQPLIDDLKLLWQGVEGVYDAVRDEVFTLKAVLFWTINDFPTYGNLSGSVTKGYNACPICVDETKPYRLKHSKKMGFLRNRRFLWRHHPYRKQAAAFDNTIEDEVAPEPLSGEEVLSRVEGLPRDFGKGKKPAKHAGGPRPCWKKKSVFFELDYWKYIPVRHILDVMHIEKNCCDAILGTLLNIPGKTKDGAVSCLDMVDMGIRTDLKPTAGPKKAKLPLVCLLEMFFPPSFFDIMIHLTVHLVREVELWGPVFFRWMYPFERYVKVFKGYVKNRHFPEGCIAEKYIVEEATEFCADRILAEDATTNTEDVQPYLAEHKEYLDLIYPNNGNNKKWMREKQNATFPVWLKDRVANELRFPNNNVSQTLRWMAAGPRNLVPTYAAAYHINKVDYNTEERDNVRSVQNSGVTLLANAMQCKVPVFNCDWVESTRGVKVDELGFTLVKLNRLGHLNDPFVLATHVKQIFCISDPLDADWLVVVRCPDIDYRGVDEDDEVHDIEVEAQPFNIPPMPSVDTFDDVDENHHSKHMRDGNEGIWIDIDSLPRVNDNLPCDIDVNEWNCT
ncbi:hypothetical protein ACLB2K_063509 [Fragaria x ananassa]